MAAYNTRISSVTSLCNSLPSTYYAVSYSQLMSTVSRKPWDPKLQRTSAEVQMVRNDHHFYRALLTMMQNHRLALQSLPSTLQNQLWQADYLRVRSKGKTMTVMAMMTAKMEVT